MQRTRFIRLKLILSIALPILVVGLCILFDQLSKSAIKNNYRLYEKNFLIDDFFFFTYTVNTGAAWSFLADKDWGQIFFKVLTGVALVGFIVFIVFTIKKKQTWLSISLAFIIGGTIGNFIDRLAFNGVTDFIGVLFGDYQFPIFNLADSFLVVGLIMLIIYYAFLDNNALFKKSKKKEEEPKKEIKPEEGKESDAKENVSGN